MEQNNLASKNSSSIPPDPKSKNWLVIGLAILVVILLGLVSFLIYQNCQLRRQFKQQTQLGFPIPTTAISWNTYKNEKFGFEIKYPGNFEVQDYSHVDDWGGKYSPTDRKGNRKSLFVFIPAQGEFEGPWLDKFDFFLSISTDTEKYGIGEQEERFFFGDEDGWRNIIKTQKKLDVLQTGNVSYNIVNNGYHYTLAFSQKYPPLSNF